MKIHLLSALVLASALSLLGCATSGTPASTVQAASHAPSKRVLMVVTNVDRIPATQKPTGFWAAEVIVPYEALTKAGYTVQLASVNGGHVPLEPFSDPRNPNSPAKNDAVSRAFLEDAGKAALLESTARLESVDLSGYDAVLFAGGTGASFDFPESAAVQKAARTLFEQGKVVAALCHGSSALLNVRLSDGAYLLKGHKATGFSNKEQELSGTPRTALPQSIEDTVAQRGGTYVGAPPFTPNVVRDGRLVTAQQPASVAQYAQALAAALAENAAK